MTVLHVVYKSTDIVCRPSHAKQGCGGGVSGSSETAVSRHVPGRPGAAKIRSQSRRKVANFSSPPADHAQFSADLIFPGQVFNIPNIRNN